MNPYTKISQINCNDTQLEKLRKYTKLPNDITRLVDVIDWLSHNADVYITVDVDTVYEVGLLYRIHVCDSVTDMYRTSYQRYERCLMEGLDMAIQSFIIPLKKDDGDFEFDA